jgi:deoxyribodipyrimidine photo-lyase
MRMGFGIHEVDAHNIVPVWVASDKLELARRPFRNKLKRILQDYNKEFPKVKT